MENFFKQQLEKIIGGNPGLGEYQASYIGRTCYLKMGRGRKAKIEFQVTTTREHYDKLSLSIVDDFNGTIDSTDILFRDAFSLQDNGAGQMLAVYIWRYPKYEWYCKPTEIEWKKLSDMVFEYVSLFD